MSSPKAHLYSANVVRFRDTLKDMIYICILLALYYEYSCNVERQSLSFQNSEIFICIELPCGG